MLDLSQITAANDGEIPGSFRVIAGRIVPLQEDARERGIVPVSEMVDGQMGVAVAGEFRGELFFKNVAGLHGVSKNRYWPSEYMHREMGKKNSAYMPEFLIRIVVDVFRKA